MRLSSSITSLPGVEKRFDVDEDDRLIVEQRTLLYADFFGQLKGGYKPGASVSVTGILSRGQQLRSSYSSKPLRHNPGTARKKPLAGLKRPPRSGS